MSGPVIRITVPINAAEVIETMVKIFSEGASGVALDLTGQNFEDTSIEDLLLEVEANFALQGKQIMVLIAPPADHEHLKEQCAKMAELIGGSKVITAVAIEGAREGVESLKRFLREKLHATMPIYAEIT